MKKVIIYHSEFSQEHVENLRHKYPCCNFIVCRDKKDIAAHSKDADAIITFRLTKEMLHDMPNLKWVQVLSAGVDSLPLKEIEARNIVLTNGRGIHKIHMSEYAIAAMINLSRNFHIMFRNQLNRKWDTSVFQGEIYGSTAGILGLGSIGKEIAKRSSFLGMYVIGMNSDGKPVEYVDEVFTSEKMDEVFKKSDYVINLLPSTPQTKELINKDYFNLMKDSACFINIGRGTTVNEPDLIEALKNKKIRAMVTDVFFVEPLPQDSPLWDLDNVILTPHICGQSKKYIDRALEIIEHNLDVFTSNSGEMINKVNLSKGY